MSLDYQEIKAFLNSLHQKAEQDNTASNQIIKMQLCEIAKVYDELEEITGYSRHTIQTMKHVADKTSLLRSKDLSYGHHRQVAPLPPEQQKEFLQKASDETFHNERILPTSARHVMFAFQILTFHNVCSPMGED